MIESKWKGRKVGMWIMSLGSNDLMKVIVLLSLTFWLMLMLDVECIIAKEVRVFMLLQIRSRSIYQLSIAA